MASLISLAQPGGPDPASARCRRRGDPVARNRGAARRCLSLLIGLVAALVLLAPLSPGHAAGPSLLPESLTGQRQEADQRAEPDVQKPQAPGKAEETAAVLQEAESFERRARELKQRIQQAPEELAKLKQSTDQRDLELDLSKVAPWTNAQLEAVLVERQARLDEMQDTLSEKVRLLSRYIVQVRTGGGELAKLEEQLASLREKPTASVGLAAPEGTETAANATQATERALIAARVRLTRAKLDWLKLQQANLNILTELAQVDRDRTVARVDAFTRHVAQLREYVLDRRQADAERVKRAAEEAVSDAPAAIRELSRKISDLTAEQSELVAKEAQFERRNDRVNRLVEQVKRDHARIRQIVELGGASAQVSALLQKRRALAPSPTTLRNEALQYQQFMSDASLRQLEIDELLRESGNPDQAVDRLIGKAAADLQGGELDDLRARAGEALTRYLDTLRELWKSYTGYIAKLSTLEGSIRVLMSEVGTYRSFIDDHLLWVPSAELIPLDQPGLLIAGLHWLVETGHVERLVDDGLRVASESRSAFAVWIAGVLVLIALYPRARLGLTDAATRVNKVRTDRFSVTMGALGHTLVLILPLPWLLVGAGLLLGGLRSADQYSLVVAAGLQGAGHAVLFLRTLRQLCRPRGVAVAHLQWQPDLCTHLSRQAAWLTPLLAPLTFIALSGAAAVPSEFIRLASVVQTEEPGLLSLGRLALIAQMILFAIAVHRIWRKGGAVMTAFAASSDRAKWTSYHILWFGPALGLPIGLALAALVGYFYTAVFLTSIAGEMLWFFVILILLKDLLLRGLYVQQRRLRFDEAVRYREEMLAQRAAGSTDESPVDGGVLAIEEEKINYSHLGSQVRQLVQLGYTLALLVGLWWILNDVVPAFRLLGEVQLPITTSKLVDGVSQDVALTLDDMATGLLLGALALFAARNIPALLELTLLQRLPMSRASRYAFTTLTQYAVAMTGLIVTFNALGLQWSNIQWLVAALSVGLGFGLQEIVANFISGIILLFEQPIRVGDVVTVDETTGTVSRIRIRATTIVNWERQELVIPNKSFITGRLINWTLTDTINRLFISVGVGYDTDTRQAMKLMAEAATEHPNVLTDPAPVISFEGFGDNALTLNMRAYLNDVGVRLNTLTELHQLVLDKFRAAGIEIAYPQRDIHLSTQAPLEMIMRREPRHEPNG